MKAQLEEIERYAKKFVEWMKRKNEEFMGNADQALRDFLVKNKHGIVVTYTTLHALVIHLIREYKYSFKKYPCSKKQFLNLKYRIVAERFDSWMKNFSHPPFNNGDKEAFLTFLAHSGYDFELSYLQFCKAGKYINNACEPKTGKRLYEYKIEEPPGTEKEFEESLVKIEKHNRELSLELMEDKKKAPFYFFKPIAENPVVILENQISGPSFKPL